jgi:hypothetical protein
LLLAELFHGTDTMKKLTFLFVLNIEFPFFLSFYINFLLAAPPRAVYFEISSNLFFSLISIFNNEAKEPTNTIYVRVGY